jgi:hypothetical protein
MEKLYCATVDCKYCNIIKIYIATLKIMHCNIKKYVATTKNK